MPKIALAKGDFKKQRIIFCLLSDSGGRRGIQAGRRTASDRLAEAITQGIGSAARSLSISIKGGISTGSMVSRGRRGGNGRHIDYRTISDRTRSDRIAGRINPLVIKI